ncbi:hypothetical protein GE09DRAFT_260227 [Coniochaeta sp. 2T2.1]|nr:hypothetical protein GE09DRAFT_260227 [Coniochaeta sp. 2T2.1]
MATGKSAPKSNGSVLSIRRLYRPLGFATVAGFILFLVFTGSLLCFAVNRINHYLHFDFCVEGPTTGRPGRPREVPGECYWFRRGLERFGYAIHIYAIIPAAFLACLQFIPALQRAKLVLFHRINGYIVLPLAVVGAVGAVIIGVRAVGGPLTFQLGNIFAATLFVTELAMAYVSIRKLRIDQHREWMLRAWIGASFIVSMRPIFLLVALKISGPNSPYYVAMDCKVIDYMLKGSHDRIMELAPGCAAYVRGEKPAQWTAIQANLDLSRKDPVGAAAAIQVSFPAVGMLLYLIHLVGAEIYIHMTSAESERLKVLSKQRQMLRAQALLGEVPSEQVPAIEQPAILDLKSGSH